MQTLSSYFKPDGATRGGTLAAGQQSSGGIGQLLRHFVKQPILGSLLLLLAPLLIYAPVLSGDLIWDDRYLVEQNPFFRSPIFACEVFRQHLFLDSPSEYYRPVQNWSYMLDYLLWRGSSTGYHLTNILLHAASAVLLHRLLRVILPEVVGGLGSDRHQFIERAALLIPLAWVVHPAHNAAVAYISGRADSLASVLALTAWLFWLKAVGAKDGLRRVAQLMLAAILLILALCSKEIALLWALLFAIYVVVVSRGYSRSCRLLTLGLTTGLVLLYL
ncbi:MAG: hypothetical protein M3R61_21490, partial [Chloroflexota bacterium]|nr:hypothetical protein [Chloroflexota bacterium]